MEYVELANSLGILMNPFTTPVPDHAIKRMAIALEYSSEKSSAEIQSFRDGFRSRAEGLHLPAAREHKGIKFSIDFDESSSRQSAQTRAASAELSAVRFARIAPDGKPELQLTFASDKLVLMHGRYVRWSEAKKTSQEIFEAVQSVQEIFGIAAVIVLEYLDEFYPVVDSELIDSTWLLRPGCPYIAPNCIGPKQAWHCFHGFYSGEELINVNAELLFDSRRMIRIRTSHRLGINSESDPLDLQKLELLLDELHGSNYRVMQAVLSDEALAMIGIGSKEGVTS